MIGTLLHGRPGHPANPPLTDATIGMFSLATGLALLGAAGVAEAKVGPAAWLALVGGLLVAAPTAVTGFADFGTLVFVHGMRVEQGAPADERAETTDDAARSAA